MRQSYSFMTFPCTENRDQVRMAADLQYYAVLSAIVATLEVEMTTNIIPLCTILGKWCIF
jgi:hypothetical protein